MVAKMMLVTCIGFMFYQFTVDDKVREGIRTRVKKILVAKVKSFNFLQEQQRFSCCVWWVEWSPPERSVPS